MSKLELPNGLMGRAVRLTRCWPRVQVGDFHDTIQLGLEAAAGGAMTVRFQTISFNGPVILHCHILGHEDQGMMAMVRVAGPRADPVLLSRHPQCTIPSGRLCRSL